MSFVNYTCVSYSWFVHEILKTVHQFAKWVKSGIEYSLCVFARPVSMINPHLRRRRIEAPFFHAFNRMDWLGKYLIQSFYEHVLHKRRLWELGGVFAAARDGLEIEMKSVTYYYTDLGMMMERRHLLSPKKTFYFNQLGPQHVYLRRSELSQRPSLLWCPRLYLLLKFIEKNLMLYFNCHTTRHGRRKTYWPFYE